VANRDPASWPQSLRDNLCLWQGRSPNLGDFPQRFQLFGPASYQYILYGMGRASTPARAAHPREQEALAEVTALTARLSRMLAPHRDGIEELTR